MPSFAKRVNGQTVQMRAAPQTRTSSRAATINIEGVVGLGEYRAFDLHGWMWLVESVATGIGFQLMDLQNRLGVVLQQIEQLTNKFTMPDDLRVEYEAVVSECVPLFRQIPIKPLGHRKIWRRFQMWRGKFDPYDGINEGEVAYLLGFFCGLRMRARVSSRPVIMPRSR